MLTLKLVTKPGQLRGDMTDVYYVTHLRGEYKLHNHGLGAKAFGSLKSLAHSLGGIVAWDRWSDDAQTQLEHLNLKGHF